MPELDKGHGITLNSRQGSGLLRGLGRTQKQPSGNAAPLCARKDDPPEAVTHSGHHSGLTKTTAQLNTQDFHPSGCARVWMPAAAVELPPLCYKYSAPRSSLVLLM